MKKILHVNQHRIRANIHRSAEDREPVLTVRTYKGMEYANEVAILDDEGEVVVKVVYRPDKPLSCGARVWIETHADVVVVS